MCRKFNIRRNIIFPIFLGIRTAHPLILIAAHLSVPALGFSNSQCSRNCEQFINEIEFSLFYRRKCDVLRCSDVDTKEPRDLSASRPTIYQTQIKLR